MHLFLEPLFHDWTVGRFGFKCVSVYKIGETRRGPSPLRCLGYAFEDRANSERGFTTERGSTRSRNFLFFISSSVIVSSSFPALFQTRYRDSLPRESLTM